MTRLAPALVAVLMLAQPVQAQDCDAACLIDAARMAAAAVPTTRDRAQAMVAIALAQVRTGQPDAAVATAQAIPDAHARGAALAEVAAALAQSGDVARAAVLARGIADAREQSLSVAALEQVALAQAAQGDVAGALALVEGFEDLFRRAEAQARIAEAQARAGDIAGALATADRIDSRVWLDDLRQRDFRFSEARFDDYWFHEARARISVVQAEAGDLTGALDTAARIADAGAQSRALSGIAVVQARAGDAAGAMDLAGRVEAAFGDLTPLIALAEAGAATGDPAALDLARNIEAAYGDATALAAFVRAGALRGEDPAAGLAIADGVRDLAGRHVVLAALAEGLADHGRVDQAVDAAVRIGDARAQADALERVAVVQARAGDAVGAQATIARIAGDRRRDAAQVAVALAQGGAAGTATAQAIADPLARALALAGLATAG